jgi:hypothetical protein
MALEIKQPNVLVVEGKEEVFFFGALVKHLGLQNIQIIDMEGKTRLKDRSVWSNTFNACNSKISPCPATHPKRRSKSFWLQDRRQEND